MICHADVKLFIVFQRKALIHLTNDIIMLWEHEKVLLNNFYIFLKKSLVILKILDIFKIFLWWDNSYMRFYFLCRQLYVILCVFISFVKLNLRKKMSLSGVFIFFTVTAWCQKISKMFAMFDTSSITVFFISLYSLECNNAYKVF